jgi:NAD(P)H-hydrate epimerase
MGSGGIKAIKNNGFAINFGYLCRSKVRFLMKVLKVRQIQDWDRFTIQNEPIASIDLMERASRVFTDWVIAKHIRKKNRILIIVSKGNNGGDGLAVARMLADHGCEVHVIIFHIQSQASPDFSRNLERLRFKQLAITEIQKGDPLPDLRNYELIIDGIFGSGLTRPVEGYWASLVGHINAQEIPVCAIDIPSGMFADCDTPLGAAVVKADACLSFEVPKLAFFFPSNEQHLNSWELRSIGLLAEFPGIRESKYDVTETLQVAKKLKTRRRFAHKGDFGKLLIAAGKRGMGGAAVLATKAALRSGAGLVFTLSADCNYNILQTSAPEAMFISGFGDDHLMASPELDKYQALGIGPGLGTHEATRSFLTQALESFDKPMILDADALNIISKEPHLLYKIPKRSILTPHPGEFNRLFGLTNSDAERLELLSAHARELELTIILKGAYTAIARPDGSVSFNTTGNPGMATGGSGDVLTGLLTGLLAQGYSPEDAAVIGVHLHGIAGDLAAKDKGQHGLTASDLIHYLPAGLKELSLLSKNEK